MTIKFNFDAATTLVAKLNTTADMIETKNAAIRGKYAALGETFKDSKYLLYKASFEECDRTIIEACAALRELNTQMLVYAERLKKLS